MHRASKHACTRGALQRGCRAAVWSSGPTGAPAAHVVSARAAEAQAPRCGPPRRRPPLSRASLPRGREGGTARTC